MSSLKFTLFGTLQVELDGERVTFNTRKALALLVYLVVTPQAQSRETLAGIFWPEFPSDQAFSNLRGALSSLKQRLTDQWIDIRRYEVSMKEDSGLWVDVVEFQRHLDTVNAHQHASDTICAGCLPSLLTAIDLYHNDFLRGFTLPDCPAFDEWQAFQADGYREQLIQAFQQVLRYDASQRDFTQASAYARRWVALCPWSEAAHRELMRVYALAHQRSAALQQYQTCARMLREEFGAEPEQETRALYDAILNEDLVFRNPHSDPLPKGEGVLLPLALQERGLGGEVIPGAEVPRPNNLPAQITSFIGREIEVEAVVTLLSRPNVRLVTLTGPGGSGKTRLSVRVAARLLAKYADGVFFVSLAPINNEDLVVPTIVTTLGLQVAGNTPPIDMLKGYLQPKNMLLVLDNFEQILATAPALHELLTAASGVNILVTSRTVLRISGEHEYFVPPLALPDLSDESARKRIPLSEAVQLFAERASAMQPNFTLTPENTLIVAQICTRLDGLPLAIELAAARINLFSPQTLLNRLESPLRVLTWGARDLPARQRTLRNTIDWSYHLLNPEEQTLFRRLAVFVGGWTLETAEAVCAMAATATLAVRSELSLEPVEGIVEGAGQVVDVLNGMQVLVDHSLVTQHKINNEPRLTMLETIREYALERLAESDDEDAIREQHALFFMALAEEAEPYWHTMGQLTWLTRLELDHNNLRAALAWSIDKDIEIGLRLAGALGSFWNFHAYIQEGRDWLANALTKSRASGAGMERWQAKALRAASLLAAMQADFMMACSLGEEGLTLWRMVGDTRETAESLRILGLVESSSGNRRRARTFLEESIALFRHIRHIHGLAGALWIYGALLFKDHDDKQARMSAEESLRLGRETGNTTALIHASLVLAEMTMHQGEYSDAQSLFEQGLKWSREAEISNSIRASLCGLGTSLDMQGHYERARVCYDEALTIEQKRGNDFGTAWRLISLGWVALHQQDWHTARTHFAASLPVFQKREYALGMAACMLGLAGVAEGDEQIEHAAQLLGTVTEMLPEFSMTRMDSLEEISMQSEYNRLMTAVRNAFGEETFAAAIATGRTMTLEQAIALALTGQHEG